MGRPRKIENLYDAPKQNVQFTEGQKSKGILDDYAVRGDVATKEGSIQHIPTAAKHITNVEYVKTHPTTLTAGSIPFSNGTILTQDNANLFWDDTNNRLGIGTASPIAKLEVNGVIENSLVAWWTMDDNLATATVIDHSINSNTGTLVDTGGTATTAFHSRIGKIGRALYFDGDDDNIKITSDSTINNREDLTIELWLKPETGYSEDDIAGIFCRQTPGLQTLYITPGTGVATWRFKISNADKDTAFGTVIPENVWSHLVVTHISGSQKVYFNGVEDGSNSFVGEIDDLTGKDFYIGMYSGGRQINGLIDEFKMYNRVLSPREISESYRKGSQLHGGTIGDNLIVDGDVGVGAVTPTAKFSVVEKGGMSAIGGFCIKLTNQTGANSVQGEVVRTDAANDDAVILAVTAETNPIGVFLESGVADGSEAWIVVSGIADVKADTAGFTRGDRLVTSLAAATVARATTNNAPAVAVHFQEIGHAIESAAANALGRCVLHFN